MYTTDGIKLSRDEMLSLQRARQSGNRQAKSAWWSTVRRRYGLSPNQKFKVRFIAVVLPK